MEITQDHHRVTAALSVVVLLTDATTPSNGELRLLDHLAADPRYTVAGLWHAPPTTAPLGLTERLRGWFEARAVPVPGPFQPRHWAPQQAAPLGDDLSDCDVILDFTWNDAVDAIAHRAQHGLWRLSAFQPQAGVTEATAGRPATQVCLTRCDANGVSETLSEAMYDTKFLARRNTEYIREKSVQLIVHKLACLYQSGSVVPIEAQLRAPRGGTLFGYGWRAARNVAGRVSDKLRTRLGRKPGGFYLRIGHGDVMSFDPAKGQTLPVPKGHFWADPFLIEHGDDVFCLYEDFDYKTGLGQIGAGRFTQDGMDDLGLVFTAPHHLSFPYLFEHESEIFMIPETHQAKRLEVWRATDFPSKWTLHATAFENAGLADTVLFEQDGTWWLLTGLCKDSFGDFCGELHLFRTSGPDLTWIEPHPLNPVVIGADTARGGGRVHKVDGRLIRTSQDNSGGGYGWGLNIMEIQSLSPTDYSEIRVRHITPDFVPGLVGCHHFDSAGGRWVIDVRKP